MRIWELVKMLEMSESFKAVHNDCSLDVTFESPDGWRFNVFMDCGEPDYINWVQPPSGDKIDLWSGPMASIGSAISTNVICLPHVSERLLAAVKQLPDWDF